MIGKKQIRGTKYEHFIGDPLPPGYVEVNDIEEALEIAELLNKDYKWKRKYLQSKDWNSLNNQGKTIVAQFRASSESNCKSILGETYQYWASEFGLLSKRCREVRFENAKTILFRMVEVQSRYTVLGFLDTTRLVENYILHGVEGTDDGDFVSGLFNFIEGTGDFITTGLPAMSLTFINDYTMNDLKTTIMDCLRNGNY